jgi:hypothetical protein
MAIDTAQGSRFGNAWGALTDLVAGEGSGAERHWSRLLNPAEPMADLVDAMHGWCSLHGQHPGVLDHAKTRQHDSVTEAWLAESVEAFAQERATLVRMVAAAGPLPSTPGQAETAAAIVHQRHALDMLARSERGGVVVGAAMALVLDWIAVREVIAIAAERLGLTLEPAQLPHPRDGATVVAALADRAGFERAMLFGTAQTLAQHRALWHLLEARASARIS